MRLFRFLRRGDGKELFFIAADGKMMSVPVKALAGSKPSVEAGTPAALFDARIAPSPINNLFEYDVTADGKRFLINTAGRPTPFCSILAMVRTFTFSSSACWKASNS